MTMVRVWAELVMLVMAFVTLVFPTNIVGEDMREEENKLGCGLESGWRELLSPG